MPDENRAPRIGIDALQDPHRFHHRDGAGAVVGRAGSAVPRIEVRRQHHILVGQLAPLGFRDHVENRHLAERLGLRGDLDDRSLIVLGEPEEQAVVLAGDIEYRRAVGVGLEDFLDAPALRPKARDDACYAGGFEPSGEPGDGGHAAARDVAGALQTLLPGLLRSGAPRLEGIGRRLRCPLLPAVVRAAGRLRKGDEHELALGLRQPGDEPSAIGDIGQDHDGCAHRPPFRRRRAPRERHALERALAGRDEIDVRSAAPPAAPRPVLFLARRDPPRRVRRDRPVLRRGHAGRRRQPRTQRVEQHLREARQLGAVGFDSPDAAQDRVVDSKARGLWELRGGGGGEGGEEADGRQSESHGAAPVSLGDEKSAQRSGRVEGSVTNPLTTSTDTSLQAH